MKTPINFHEVRPDKKIQGNLRELILFFYTNVYTWPTFYNGNIGALQCLAKRYRSYQDCHSFIINYLQVDEKDVLKECVLLAGEGIFFGFYCDDIENINFIYRKVDTRWEPSFYYGKERYKKGLYYLSFDSDTHKLICDAIDDPSYI